MNHNGVSGVPSVGKGVAAVKGFLDGGLPYFEERNLRITGITKDSTGAALGNCTVELFDTNTDIRKDSVVSNASGNYITQIPKGLSQIQDTTWYLVAYKAGSFDVAGTTVNTLRGEAASVLLTGLISYWHMDESSGNIIDAIGINNGTPTGITYSQSGQVSTALLFNGTTSQIECGTFSPISIFTFMAWVKPTGSTDRGVICIPSATNDRGPYLRVNAANTLSLLKNGVAVIGTSSGTVTNGVWTHVAVSYDASGNYVFYINGSASGSGTNLQTFVEDRIVVGWQGNSEFFNGIIDEVAIYNRVIPGIDVMTAYSRGIAGLQLF